MARPTFTPSTGTEIRDGSGFKVTSGDEVFTDVVTTDPFAGPGAGGTGGGGTGSKPPRPPAEPPTPLPSRTDVFRRQKEPLRVIYGKRHIRGAFRAYDKVQSDGRRLVVYYICWGPINSVSNITIDGVDITAVGSGGLNLTATVDYNIYLSGDSSADAIMAARDANWALVEHPADVVTLVVLFQKPTHDRPPVNVEAIEADIEGILVRDPRSDATLVTKYYRENPMLAVADFMCDTRFGGGFPTAMLDWSGTVTSAANDCDTDLGGGRKRYTIGLELNQTMGFEEVLDLMRGHAALMYAFNNALFQFWVDLDRTSTGISYANSTGGRNIVSASALDYKGTAQIPTRVNVWFTNESAGWKEDVAVSDHPDLASGGVELVEWTYHYFGVRTYDQAKRLANYIRKRHSIEKSGRIRVKASGLRVLPGSRITISNLVEWNWSAVEALVLECGPVPGTSTWDLLIEPYDSSVYDDTEETTTSYTSPISPSPFDAPPDIIDAAGSASATTGHSTFYFSRPKARSTTTYGAAYFSATLLSSFTAANVNDGNTSVTAFLFNAGAGTSGVVFDAGVGNTKTFREVQYSYDTTTTLDGAPVIEYSDDAAAWTAVSSASGSLTYTDSGSIRTYRKQFPTGGAHRYWRLRRSTSGTSATRFTEVWFKELGDDYHLISHYNIYDTRTGSRVFYASIKPADIPTSTNPFYLDPIQTYVPLTWNSNGSNTVTFEVTVVSIAGLESGGVAPTIFSSGASAAGGSAGYLPYTQSSLTLANGLNSNITLSAGPGLHYITGPTGAFSLGGFAVGSFPGGTILTVYNPTTQVMTVVNEDASSTAANRIETLTGSNVLIKGTCLAVFEYVTTKARWVLVAYEPRHTEYALTAANGLNSNLTLSSGPGLKYLSGPTGAFSLGGFVAPTTTAGWQITVYNSTAQTMTIVNEDASSTAANRIETGTGANVVIKGTSTAVFQYVPTKARWVLVGYEPRYLSGSGTWDPASVANGASTTTTVSVTGAVMGDHVTVSFSLDLLGCSLSGFVSAANTVTVVLSNLSGGAVNLASGTVSAKVWR